MTEWIDLLNAGDVSTIRRGLLGSGNWKPSDVLSMDDAEVLEMGDDYATEIVGVLTRGGETTLTIP